MVSNLFGKVYSVKLSKLKFNRPQHRQYKRYVSEDRSRISKDQLVRKTFEALSEADLARVLHRQLTQLASKHRKSKEEVADLFVRLSGDLDSVKSHLQQSKRQHQQQ